MSKKKKNSRFNDTNYFSELVKILREGGLRLLIHYLNLKLRQVLGFKTFKAHCSNICTNNGKITVRQEYQYREGSYLERVIAEDVSFKDFFINVRLNFIDENRRITCSHTMRPFTYSGMWRIWDKGHHDIEEWRRERDGIDYSALDNIPVIEIP